jgi:DNA-binding IclR family transcriptional regulator
MEHNAIEKALLVLTSFANGNNPIGTVELAERLGLNKTTVSRIMTTLKKRDFLDQDPKTKQYRLGPVVALLGKSVIQGLEGQMTLLAQQYCNRLRDQVGETVHFEVLSGNHLYLAYAARGPNPVSVAIDVGDQVYPNVHAGAKAIAAYSDPELVDRWLNNEPPVYTSKTISDASKLREKYAEFRELGITVDDGEYDENVYAIGAPVFNHNCAAVAGIVIVAPYMRKKDLERPHVVRALKEAATLVSGRLLCPKEYQDVCNQYLNNYHK